MEESNIDKVAALPQEAARSRGALGPVAPVTPWQGSAVRDRRTRRDRSNTRPDVNRKVRFTCYLKYYGTTTRFAGPRAKESGTYVRRPGSFGQIMLKMG